MSKCAICKSTDNRKSVQHFLFECKALEKERLESRIYTREHLDEELPKFFTQKKKIKKMLSFIKLGLRKRGEILGQRKYNR